MNEAVRTMVQSADSLVLRAGPKDAAREVQYCLSQLSNRNRVKMVLHDILMVLEDWGSLPPPPHYLEFVIDTAIQMKH